MSNETSPPSQGASQTGRERSFHSLSFARQMLAEQFRHQPDKVYEAARSRLATARRKGSSGELVPGDAYEYS